MDTDASQPGHFHLALLNIRSLQCLCTDIQTLDILVVLSNAIEVAEFRALSEQYFAKPCPDHFGIFPIAEHERQKPMPPLKFVNMYDILPSVLKSMQDVNENSTQAIHNVYGKYKYQAIKKLQTARYFAYRHVLWLDSEGIAVQPFSFQKVFDDYLKSEYTVLWYLEQQD